MTDKTNILSSKITSKTDAFANAPQSDVEIKRSEQQIYAQNRRWQIETRYAQERQLSQQDKDKLKPKPGERIVTVRGNKIIKTEIVPEQPVKPTLATYARQAEKLIKGAGDDVRERNRAISGAYASLYLKNPTAFEWLGAAAYASGQVGFLIDVLDTAKKMGALGAILPVNAAGVVIKENAGALKKMMADGNSAIYNSIMPVSLAYQKGGIQELRRLRTTLQGNGKALENFDPLLNAYEQIDKGVKLNQKKAGAGDMLITDGTNAIIDFEQRVIAQTLFDRHPKLVWAMGLLAFGDLDANDANIDRDTLSAFQLHSPGGNFGNADTRVDWIKNEIFVKWDKHRTERADEVRGQMNTMIIAGQAAGGRY